MSQSKQSLTHPLWTLDIHETDLTSPVIAKDGTIYLAAREAILIAIQPNGILKWKKPILTIHDVDHPSVVLSSPTIADNGCIYVVTTRNAIIEDKRKNVASSIPIRRSSLHSFTPSGNKRWTYRLPSPITHHGLGAYTAASPIIHNATNPYIFITARYSENPCLVELLAVNDMGNLITKAIVSSNHDKIDPENRLWDNIYLNHTNANTLSLSQSNILVYDNIKTLSAYQWRFPVIQLLWSIEIENRGDTLSSIYYYDDHLFLQQKNIIYSIKNQKITEWYQNENLSPLAFHHGKIVLMQGDDLIILDYDGQIQNKYHLNHKALSVPPVIDTKGNIIILDNKGTLSYFDTTL